MAASGGSNQKIDFGNGGEWGIPSFQHQKTISMDWSLEEQIILEEGLVKYASDSVIIRYAKIAVQLENKTVRDVALRCRWMAKNEISNRRKDDFIARKSKDRKDKVVDSMLKPPSHLAAHSGLSQDLGPASNFSNGDIFSYNNGIASTTRQLLQNNAWTLKQISSNLAIHQIHENIGLLGQARDNIVQILAKLNDMGATMKKMPPLPKLNEELANSVLPPSTIQIH